MKCNGIIIINGLEKTPQAKYTLIYIFYYIIYISDVKWIFQFYIYSSCRRPGPRLRAAEFLIGNKEHQDLIGRMGIKISTMSDGRLQLLHSSGSVSFCSNDKSRRISNLLEVVILEL